MKTYLKDKLPMALFYSIGIVLAFLFIIMKVTDFSSGEVSNNTIKILMLIPLVPFAGCYAFLLLKDAIIVALDYWKKEIVIADLKLRFSCYEKCDFPQNGAYFIVGFCGKKENFWMYNKNQIYFEAVSQETYRVEYYKHSRCIKTIERITYNRKDVKSKPKKKNLIRQPKIDNYKEFSKNYIYGFVINIVFSLMIPFFIIFLKDVYRKCMEIGVQTTFVLAVAFFVGFYIFVVQSLLKKVASFICYKNNNTFTKIVTVYSIPKTKKFLINENSYEFKLMVIDSKGTKKRIKFYSTEVLGLGDLKERPGYRGYGNFIGSVYEVEYYKISHVVKSMKLISQPNVENQSGETKQSDGSVIDPGNN